MKIFFDKESIISTIPSHILNCEIGNIFFTASPLPPPIYQEREPKYKMNKSAN